MGGWGGVGSDLWVVGESDGVSGISNQLNKVSVVISELKFGATVPLHPPIKNSWIRPCKSLIT